MRKKSSLFLVAFIIIACVISSCSSSNKVSVESSGTGESTNATNLGSTGTESENLGKYDPAIDVTWVYSSDPTIDTNVLPYVDDTVEKNRWLKKYEDDMGIKIKYNWIAKDAAEYDQKLNLSMASGDLPDYFSVNATQLKNLVKSDMVTDLTNIFEKYASGNTKQILCNDEYTKPGFASCTYDKKLMAIPRFVPIHDEASYLWIRTDWLQKLGLSAPKSMSDVNNIIKAFAKNDPDGNNKDDTYGLMLGKSFCGMRGYFEGYHSYIGSWIDDESGNLIYGSIQPETKTALKELSVLYKDKCIDKEFAIKDITKLGEDAAKNKSGIMYGYHWYSLWPLNWTVDNIPDSDWKAYPIASSDDKQAKTVMKLPVLKYYVANKSAKNPEAIVKMLNVVMDTLYGSNNQFDQYFSPIGKDGHVAESLIKLSPIEEHHPYFNINFYKGMADALKKDESSLIKDTATKDYYNKVIAYTKKGDKSFWGWNAFVGADSAMTVLDGYINANQFICDENIYAPTPTSIDKGSVLGDLEQEYFTKIIMGENDISAFDEFVSKWYELGGTQLTKEINEASGNQ